MNRDSLDRHITGNWGEDGVPPEPTPATIRYGFLTGNLLSGMSQEDLDGMDVPASVQTFVRMMQRALTTAYPGAKVSVPFYDYTGCVPADIITGAWDANGDDLPEVVDDVENIGSSVFLAEWIVPRNPRATVEAIEELLRD